MLKAALLSFLAFLAAALISWKAPAPGPPAEPKTAAQVLPSVVIVREGGSDRVQAAPADWRSLAVPTYSIGWTATSHAQVTRTLGYDGRADRLLGGPEPRISLGLYHLRGEWRYALGMAHRMDQGPRTPEAPETLDTAHVQSLQRQILAQLGSRGQILSAPLVVESSICWQNAFSLLACIALFLTPVFLLLAALRRGPAPAV